MTSEKCGHVDSPLPPKVRMSQFDSGPRVNAGLSGNHRTLAVGAVKRIQQWSLKYERYEVALVSVLSPFIGSYVCIAIGDGLEWNPVTTLAATFSTTILSVFLIIYGEQWVIGVFAR